MKDVLIVLSKGYKKRTFQKPGAQNEIYDGNRLITKSQNVMDVTFS
jgi:hypothetical protein